MYFCFVFIEKLYSDVPSLLDDLVARNIEAVLVDTFTMTSYTKLLDQKFLKVKNMIKTNTGYGFVLAGITQAVHGDVASLLRANEKTIADFIVTMEEKMPVSFEEYSFSYRTSQIA